MTNKRVNGIVLALAVLAVLGFAVNRIYLGMSVSARAAEETRAEEGERKECMRRLALFYSAWKQYGADHKGAEPPSVQAMIPKYIHDPSLLECPTAVRLDKQGKHLDRGGFELNRKNIDVTYGFRWLTAGYSLQVVKRGADIPLIVCTTHRDAVYEMAYKKQANETAFDDANRVKLVSDVANAPILGVRLNGKVEALDPSADR